MRKAFSSGDVLKKTGPGMFPGPLSYKVCMPPRTLGPSVYLNPQYVWNDLPY